MLRSEAYFYVQDQLAKRQAAQVTGIVVYDLTKCDPENPLEVVVSNDASEAVIRSRYWLVAFEPDYSDPVYETDSPGISSSFIVKPGTKAGGCHSLPPASRSTDTPDADLIWKVREIDPTFGQAP